MNSGLGSTGGADVYSSVQNNHDYGFDMHFPRNTVYPSHWHEAVEHYLVLSGAADWQMDDAPYAMRRPGKAFIHSSNQRHATTTHDEPLLAMGEVHYLGQPVFLVVATSHPAARKAARLGQISYDEK